MPEVAILTELGPLMRAAVDAGASAEDAVRAATSQVSTDLLLDARARLLDALAHDQRCVESLLEGRDGDCVLVTASLTPSVVASLPRQIVGIVAASDDTSPLGGEGTSHAVVLARGRAIPLAFMAANVVSTIANDDTVVLDTTGNVSWLWVAPGDHVVVEARQRHARWLRGRAEEETEVASTPRLAYLDLEVRVSVGSRSRANSPRQPTASGSCEPRCSSRDARPRRASSEQLARTFRSICRRGARATPPSSFAASVREATSRWPG